MTTSANDAAPDGPTITLLITEGTPNEGTLTVRVTWEYRVELRDLLVGEGLRASDVMEFSTGADLLAILDVGMPAGGLAAVGLVLKKVLELFVERQKARKIRVKVGDIEVDTEATSQRDVDRIIDRAVDAAIELQRQRDIGWANVRDKLSREHNDPPADESATSSN